MTKPTLISQLFTFSFPIWARAQRYIFYYTAMLWVVDRVDSRVHLTAFDCTYLLHERWAFEDMARETMRISGYMVGYLGNFYYCFCNVASCTYFEQLHCLRG